MLDFNYIVIFISTVPLCCQVSVPFAYGVGVQPIPLVTSEPAAEEMATIAGWGATRYLGSGSFYLMVASVPIVDRELCNEDYVLLYGGITKYMICAGLKEGGKDACSSDSGGPLVVGGKLAGIISWGENCAKPDYPGVYTNVALVRDFIFNITGIE